MDHFSYLWSLQSNKALTRKYTTASALLVVLSWGWESESLKTTISKPGQRFCSTKPTAMYDWECWTAHSREMKVLEWHHQRRLWRIRNVTWGYKHTYTWILKEANIPSVIAIITQHKLQRICNVIGNPDLCLLKQVLYWQLPKGRYVQCRTKDLGGHCNNQHGVCCGPRWCHNIP